MSRRGELASGIAASGVVEGSGTSYDYHEGHEIKDSAFVIDLKGMRNKAGRLCRQQQAGQLLGLPLPE